MGNYDDIINLPHYQSRKRPAMTILNRAAQFSPFAALTGHGAAIVETARLTDCQIELDENCKQELDRRMRFLFSRLQEKPTVTFTHFVKDGLKDGGFYHVATGVVKKTDEYASTLTLEDGTVLHVPDILAVDGELFEEME